ncbi:MAG: transposase family protein [Psychrobium sp.]|nr:transposase family protein [Psychrobium sp.]
MKIGFLYLVAIINSYSRKILSSRLSNTMDTQFCLDEALQRHGKPEIFNSDQGRFTSNEVTAKLKAYNIRINMDEKGCWGDNVMIERFWRSLKYEEVDL